MGWVMKNVHMEHLKKCICVEESPRLQGLPMSSLGPVPLRLLREKDGREANEHELSQPKHPRLVCAHLLKVAGDSKIDWLDPDPEDKAVSDWEEVLK